MATFRAINAAGAALVGLLRDGYPRDEFGGVLDIELYQTRNFEKPMTEGFSVFLYRVAPNGAIRNLPPRRATDGRVFRPSLPVDLQFMVTPWSENPERHHRMLGWALRMFQDFGTLSDSQLNNYVAETDTFAPEEAVDIVFEPLVLADYFTLWDRLRTLPASITYVLRMLRLDSEIGMLEGPAVQTRLFEMGEVNP
jgi:hypothetical protein